MRHDSCSHQSMCSRRNEWFFQSGRDKVTEPEQPSTKEGQIVIDPNPMLGEV